MTKAKKTTTKTISSRKTGKEVISHRKNTTPSTRTEGRQRSGNNGSQQGSH